MGFLALVKLLLLFGVFSVRHWALFSTLSMSDSWEHQTDLKVPLEISFYWGVCR
ncbi:hypothetical protein M758_1G135300 [Ceratodon purpureus]|uniref:Uncharacterized protein n=1 Tax=Ceratodon purpureus TaxID=3225 RepID=A0A8T0J8A1_CERPU|nr:hypothetical protein KC19_1G140400 [Ceratodon purpureus]KAG0629866.1 hypothetical protein M758_1G135300 [Ceratodon purpureus]